MRVDLDAVAVFAKVVQSGSFRKAALLLRMPTTTVSSKVARLEKRLGLTLIQRTTRRLNVTPAGQAYFSSCVRGLARIQAAESELTTSIEPRGALRISAPAAVAHELLPPLTARYVRMYPRVTVELIVTNRVVDLLGEGIDLAIRLATFHDPGLVAHRFMSYTGGLWASAAYLSQRGVPVTPADLREHDYLLFSKLSQQTLRLTDGHHQLAVALKPHIAADDLEALRAFVLEGAGIAPLPDFLTGHADRDAKLVRVLPRWTWTAGALSFVYPSRLFVAANVRAFIEMAMTGLKKTQA